MQRNTNHKTYLPVQPPGPPGSSSESTTITSPSSLSPAVLSSSPPVELCTPSIIISLFERVPGSEAEVVEVGGFNFDFGFGLLVPGEDDTDSFVPGTVPFLFAAADPRAAAMSLANSVLFAFCPQVERIEKT